MCYLVCGVDVGLVVVYADDGEVFVFDGFLVAEESGGSADTKVQNRGVFVDTLQHHLIPQLCHMHDDGVIDLGRYQAERKESGEQAARDVKIPHHCCCWMIV